MADLDTSGLIEELNKQQARPMTFRADRPARQKTEGTGAKVAALLSQGIDLPDTKPSPVVPVVDIAAERGAIEQQGRTFLGDAAIAAGAAMSTSIEAGIFKSLTSNRPDYIADPNFTITDHMATVNKYWDYKDEIVNSVHSKESLDALTADLDERNMALSGMGQSMTGTMLGSLLVPSSLIALTGEVKLGQALYRASQVGKVGTLGIGAAVGAGVWGAHEVARQVATTHEIDDVKAVGISMLMSAAVGSFGLALIAKAERKALQEALLTDSAKAAEMPLAIASAKRADMEPLAWAKEQTNIAREEWARLAQAQALASANAGKTLASGAARTDTDLLAATRAGQSAARTAEEINAELALTTKAEGGALPAGSITMEAGAAERNIIDGANREAVTRNVDMAALTAWEAFVAKGNGVLSALDTFSPMMKSASNVVKSFADRVGEDASGIYRRYSSGGAVFKDRIKRVYQGFLIPITDERNAWVRRQGYSQGDIITGKADRDFHMILREELEHRANSRGLTQAERDASDLQRMQTLPPEIQRSVQHWERAHGYAAEQWAMHDDVVMASFGSRTDGRGYVKRQLDGKYLHAMASNDPAKYAALLKLQGERMFEHINQRIDERIAAGETRTVYVKLGNNLVPEERALTHITEEQAHKMAAAFFEDARDRSMNIYGSTIGLLPHDGRDELRRLLGTKGMDEAEMNTLFGIIDERLGDSGRSARAKGRLDIDIATKDANGNSLLEVYVNNLPQLAHSYADEFSGRTALARSGIKNDAEFNTWIDAAKKTGATIDDIKNMQHLYDGMLGRGQNASPVVAGALSAMRSAMLGQVAFAQTAELATVASGVGLKAVVAQSFNMSKIMQKLTGRGLSRGDELLESLSPWLGKVGEDHRLMSVSRNFDNSWATQGDAAFLFDTAVKANKNVNDIMGGFNVIHGFQRKLAVVGMVDKTIGMLKSGEMHPRLLDAGIDANWAARIQKELKHVEFTPDGKVADLHLDKWKDGGAVEQYVDSLHRVAGQLVQGHFVGELSHFMSGDIGKVITSFRTFPLVALKKQLVRNLYHADSQMAIMASVGFAWAGLVMAAKTQLNSIGMDEKTRKEYLDKNLETGALLNKAAMYTPIFGLFGDIPNLANATFGDHTRAVNLGGQIPVLGFGSNVVGVGVDAARAATNTADKPFDTRKAIRSVNNSLPAVWLANALDSN